MVQLAHVEYYTPTNVQPSHDSARIINSDTYLLLQLRKRVFSMGRARECCTTALRLDDVHLDRPPIVNTALSANLDAFAIINDEYRPLVDGETRAHVLVVHKFVFAGDEL